MFSRFSAQVTRYLGNQARFMSNQVGKFSGKDHVYYYGPASGAFQLLQNRDSEPLKGKEISCIVYPHWTQNIDPAFHNRPWGQNPFAMPMFWQILHIKNKGHVDYNRLMTWKETGDVHTALQETLLEHDRISGNGFNVQVMSATETVEKFLQDGILVRDTITNKKRVVSYIEGFDLSKTVFVNNGQEARTPTFHFEDGVVKLYPQGTHEAPVIVCQQLAGHDSSVSQLRTISPEDPRNGIYSRNPEELVASQPQGFRLAHYGLGFVGGWHIETFRDEQGKCQMLFIAPKKELPYSPRNTNLSLDNVDVYEVGDPRLQIGVENGVTIVRFEDNVYFLNDLYASANYRPATEKTLALPPEQVIHTNPAVNEGTYCLQTKETSRSCFFTSTPEGEVTKQAKPQGQPAFTTSDVPPGSMPDRYANMAKQLGLSVLRDPRFITVDMEAFKDAVRKEAQEAGEIDIDDEVFERFKQYIEDISAKSNALAARSKEPGLDAETREKYRKESIRLANPMHPVTYINVFVQKYLEVMKEKDWESVEKVGSPLTKLGIDYEKNAEVLKNHLVDLAKNAYNQDKELIDPVKRDDSTFQL